MDNLHTKPWAPEQNFAPTLSRSTTSLQYQTKATKQLLHMDQRADMAPKLRPQNFHS